MLITRKGQLRKSIKELEVCDVDQLIVIFEEFESSNLKTIKKLKRKKKITMNRINGAIRQTINDHGDIDKDLTGSLSKRIYGSLLEQEKINNFRTNLKILPIVLLILLVILLLYII